MAEDNKRLRLSHRAQYLEKALYLQQMQHEVEKAEGEREMEIKMKKCLLKVEETADRRVRQLQKMMEGMRAQFEECLAEYQETMNVMKEHIAAAVEKARAEAENEVRKKIEYEGKEKVLELERRLVDTEEQCRSTIVAKENELTLKLHQARKGFQAEVAAAQEKTTKAESDRVQLISQMTANRGKAEQLALENESLRAELGRAREELQKSHGDNQGLHQVINKMNTKLEFFELMNSQLEREARHDKERRTASILRQDQGALSVKKTRPARDTLEEIFNLPATDVASMAVPRSPLAKRVAKAVRTTIKT